MKSKKLFLCLGLFILFLSTQADAASIFSDEYIPIESNGLGHLNIHLLKASGKNEQGKIILFLHGFAHNANIFQPLIEMLLKEDSFAQTVSTLYAIDLPAHGKSSLSTKKKLGSIQLVDYEEVLEHVLRKLKKVDVIVAHSMGTLLVNMLQNHLFQSDRNLFQEYGTEHVVFLAPVIPRPLEWELADHEFALTLKLAPLVALDISNGLYGVLSINFSAEKFYKYFFIAHEKLVQGAPSKEIVESSLKDPDSYFASAEMAGMNIFSSSNDRKILKRPLIYKKIFNPSSGSLLSVVAFEQDSLMTPDEIKKLYEYLSEDESNKRFYFLKGDEAVHDAFYSDPSNKIFLKVFAN